MIALFGLLGYEGYALVSGGETLSAAMADLDRAWPFFGELVGLVVGGLMVHFFWVWKPKRNSKFQIPDSKLKKPEDRSCNL